MKTFYILENMQQENLNLRDNLLKVFPKWKWFTENRHKLSWVKVFGDNRSSTPKQR